MSPQDSEILRLYRAWVELETNIAQAQDHLSQVLAARCKAVALRQEAQEILEQGDALREESQRTGDAAWRAFDRGFSTNIRGFANRRAMVREIDLSRRAWDSFIQHTEPKEFPALQAVFDRVLHWHCSPPDPGTD